MKSWEKNLYFGSRTQPLPFWTEGSHTADGVLRKAYLELTYTLPVCLPWQSRASKEFSVKDNKTQQWKIYLCKIEVFKIPLLSNWFQFSLVTILWGQTKLNLKKFSLLNRREIFFWVSSTLYRVISITTW